MEVSRVSRVSFILRMFLSLVLLGLCLKCFCAPFETYGFAGPLGKH